jgi:DNA-directed RNA polymerase specialized sigma subunit
MYNYGKKNGGNMAGFDFRYMRRLINRLPMARLNVDRAMVRTSRMTAQYSDMPRGGNKTSDPTGDGTVLYMAAKEAYQNLKNELEEMQTQISPKIESLKHPLQRNVMRMRYIECRSVREIAYYLNYSEQHIFRIVSRCEEKINQDESCER